MKLAFSNVICVKRGSYGPLRKERQSAFTYVEVLVASGIGAVLLAVLLAMYLYGEKSFALMTNYSEMDGKSRNAVTLLSQEIRGATRVLQARTNASGKTLTLTNANDGYALTLSWDSRAQTLTLRKLTNSGVLLTGCDNWNYTLYDGAPIFKAGDVSFSPSLSASTCRLIEMSWTCSRTVSGKMHPSGVESVRFALRNTQ